MRNISIVIFCTAMLMSCANVWRFEKNALVAHGQKLNGSKEPLYYAISIDMTKSVDEPAKNFLLKLNPDSPPISFNQLNPELVVLYLPPFTPPPQWPDRWKQKVKEEQVFSGGGFHISFKNGQLLFVDICSHCSNGRESPVVGTMDGQHFYALPLTEQQVVEVFGSPKRIYRVNEVRY